MQRFAKICKKLQKKYASLHNFSPSAALLIENFLTNLPHFYNLIIFAAIDSKQPKIHYSKKNRFLSHPQVLLNKGVTPNLSRNTLFCANYLF